MWDYLASDAAWSGRNGPARAHVGPRQDLGGRHRRRRASSPSRPRSCSATCAGARCSPCRWSTSAGRSRPSPSSPCCFPFSLRYGFGLGFWPTLVALVLLAIPPIFTNTYTGVRDGARRRRRGGPGHGHARRRAGPQGRGARGHAADPHRAAGVGRAGRGHRHARRPRRLPRPRHADRQGFTSPEQGPAARRRHRRGPAGAAHRRASFAAGPSAAWCPGAGRRAAEADVTGHRPAARRPPPDANPIRQRHLRGKDTDP